MNIGMLWFDNDPKTDFSAKIERAAVYYRNKYGKMPTLCFVHPSMIPVALPAENQAGNGSGKQLEEVAESGPNEEKYQVVDLKNGGIEVRSTRSVLPNHFWIGVNGANS